MEQTISITAIRDANTLTSSIRPIEEVIEKRCDEVDELLQTKLYSDIPMMFPDGEKVIQFRNEKDRANLSNVGAAALALIIGGNPSYLMEWRTLDNITQMVPAIQMLQISNGVLAAKQTIVSAAWNHKDTLRTMTIMNDVVTYNIEANW